MKKLHVLTPEGLQCECNAYMCLCVLTVLDLGSKLGNTAFKHVTALL